MIAEKLGIALVTLALSATSTQAAPLPLWQLDYPVLAMGESGKMRLQIPSSAGGLGSEDYGAWSIDRETGAESGYRFIAVECPSGFRPAHFDNGAFVLCYRVDGKPHAAVEMVVHVLNVNATEGETVMKHGLAAVVDGVTTSPWRIYGVR